MKKNLTLFALLIAFFFSSSILIAQKTQTSTVIVKPTKTEIKATPAKPSVKSTPAVVTPVKPAVKPTPAVVTPTKPTVNKSSATPTPISAVDKRSNEKYKDGTTPERPVSIGDDNTLEKPETAGDVPNAKTIEKDLYANFWITYSIFNKQEFTEDLRGCNCQGTITFFNHTTDTLDMYFGYLSTTGPFATANAQIPNWRYNDQRAAFYIAPGEKATIRSWCDGALQYQAIGRKTKMDESKKLTPWFEQKHYLNMSCRDFTIDLGK